MAYQGMILPADGHALKASADGRCRAGCGCGRGRLPSAVLPPVVDPDEGTLTGSARKESACSACRAPNLPAVPQVAFPFGGQVHEVHLPPFQFEYAGRDADPVEPRVRLQEEATTVLQCLTGELRGLPRQANFWLQLVWQQSI